MRTEAVAALLGLVVVPIGAGVIARETREPLRLSRSQLILAARAELRREGVHGRIRCVLNDVPNSVFCTSAGQTFGFLFGSDHR
jgi:hypothetical protein